jgi:hypothetical protein
MMDREHFDALARLVWTKKSRRTALGIVFGAALLRAVPDPLAAKGKHKRRRKHRRQRRNNRPCSPGTNCTLGQGQDNAECDFSGSVAFFELEAQGSNLSHANFTDAQMAGANFQGANLGNACLVGSNLLGAAIDAATNVQDAVFCRTLMPDGSFNDRDCGKGSRCCPAPFSCVGERCPATCIDAPNAQCSLSIPYGGCCPGLVCVPSSTAPIRTTCQTPCGEDGSCRARFGTPWQCAFEPETCRYLQGQCCQHV